MLVSKVCFYVSFKIKFQNSFSYSNLVQFCVQFCLQFHSQLLYGHWNNQFFRSINVRLCPSKLWNLMILFTIAIRIDAFVRRKFFGKIRLRDEMLTCKPFFSILIECHFNYVNLRSWSTYTRRCFLCCHRHRFADAKEKQYPQLDHLMW